MHQALVGGRILSELPLQCDSRPCSSASPWPLRPAPSPPAARGFSALVGKGRENACAEPLIMLERCRYYLERGTAALRADGGLSALRQFARFLVRRWFFLQLAWESVEFHLIAPRRSALA